GDVNLQVCGALNHVLVRNDVACRVDDETGAETLQSLANFARPNAIVAEELRVKIFDWIAHRAPHYSLSINIYHCRQDFCHCQNSWFRSRIGLAKTSFYLRQNH